MTGCILVVAAALAACGTGSADRTPAAAVSVGLDTPIAETSDRFLSFAIDVSALVRETPYDFSRVRLRNMTAALAPAHLRIGGTQADDLYYDLSDTPVDAPPAPYEGLLTRERWDAACGFAADLGLDLIFTLNAGAGPRDADDAWSGDNARPLVEHAALEGCPVAAWELGNEVNLFWARSLCLEPADYARDFAAARALVDDVDPDVRLTGPGNLFWPEMCELPPVGCDFSTADFVAEAADSIDVVTWHYYPQQSDDDSCILTPRPAEVETLLDPANLDDVGPCAEAVESGRDDFAPDAEVWLTETGHALCGGQDGLSDTFVTGFWWLDQLGLLARRGQDVVVRQALTGGTYHLIDNPTLQPRPDYWNSLLWKRLMGARVLAASVAEEAGPQLRVYAHCAVEGGGAVTVLLVNLAAEDSVPLAFDFAPGPREVYEVTGQIPSSMEECLEERPAHCSEVRVNDVVLAVDAEGNPPAISPEIVSGSVRVPARSYSFVALPEANAPACR